MPPKKSFTQAGANGVLNNWLRKSPAPTRKSLTRTQQSEAQLKVVVKGGEEISAIILYSR